MPITIFYAWQADLDERINRYFIRDAISRAITKLSADATVTDAPQLDHDTRGVSGTPDVFRTILEKIDSCAIFLADVTPVAKHASVSGETKQTPNANVMLELGYALARVSDRRILTVFNEAFGSPREAPFDWSRRRWPLSYNLSADSPDRKRHLEELASDIAGAIKSVLNSGPVTNLDTALRRRLELIVADPANEVTGVRAGTSEGVFAQRLDAVGLFAALKDVQDLHTIASSPAEFDVMDRFVGAYRQFRRDAAALDEWSIAVIRKRTNSAGMASNVWPLAAAYAYLRLDGMTDTDSLDQIRAMSDIHNPTYFREMWEALQRNGDFLDRVQQLRKLRDQMITHLRDWLQVTGWA